MNRVSSYVSLLADVSSENIEKFKKISSWDVVKLSDNSVQYKVSTPHFAKEFEVEFGKLQDDTFLDGQPYKVLIEVLTEEFCVLKIFIKIFEYTFFGFSTVTLSRFR